MRIDGSLYGWDQFLETFVDVDLHWIATQEVIDSRIPTAFTSEEARSAYLGLPEEARLAGSGRDGGSAGQGEDLGPSPRKWLGGCLQGEPEHDG